MITSVFLTIGFSYIICLQNTDNDAEWLEFKLKYNKNYTSITEELSR